MVVDHPLKTAFLRCMTYMYPHDVASKMDKRQIRDLIKVFSMGYIEALEWRGDWDAHAEVLLFIKPTTDFNWWPDESWQWWTKTIEGGLRRG